MECARLSVVREIAACTNLPEWWVNMDKGVFFRKKFLAVSDLILIENIVAFNLVHIY